jgi:hypothetical protein
VANTQGVRAGKAFVELGVSDKLTKGLRAAQKRLQAFGASVSSIGARIAALGAAGLAPLAAAVRTFSSAGDVLDKMAARTGLSAEALSELGFAAELSGADLGTLEKGVRKMQKSILDAERGLVTTKEAMVQLGLTVDDLKGLAPEKQFLLIADRLSRIEDPTRRAALAMELFGRAGTGLLPLLKDGAQGIEAMREEARRLGLTVSTQTAKDAALLTDTLHTLWRVVKQGVFVIGSALAPAVVELSNAVTRTVVRVSEWIKQNKALVISAAKIAIGVTGVGLALVAVGAVISGVGAALGTLASITAGVGTALGVVVSVLGAMLSPIGLVVSAIVALGGTLLVVSGAGAEALDWLGEQFGRLRDTVYKVVVGISDALAAGDITLAAQILWLSLKVVWEKGTLELRKIWERTTQFFVGVFHDALAGTLTIAESIWHGLQVAWIETTSFMSRGWERFTSFLTETWLTIANLLTKTWNRLRGLFDGSFDAAAANLAADQALIDKLGENDRETARALTELESKRAAAREREAQIHAQTQEEIAKAHVESLEEGAAESQKRIDAAQHELDQASAELARSIEQAKKRREEADKAGAPRSKTGDPLADLEDRLSTIGAGIAKTSVTGTFNVATLGGLADADIAKRTATGVEKIATHMVTLIRETRKSRVVFG